MGEINIVPSTRAEMEIHSLELSFCSWLEKERAEVTEGLAKTEKQLSSFYMGGFDLRYHLSSPYAIGGLLNELGDPQNENLKEFVELLLKREVWKVLDERLENVWTDREAFLLLFDKYAEKNRRAVNSIFVHVFHSLGKARFR